MRIAIDHRGHVYRLRLLSRWQASGSQNLLHALGFLARRWLDALRRIERKGEVLVRHGTTVGTNAMIERKGARVAFVTTAGFEDTMRLAARHAPGSTTGFSRRRIALRPHISGSESRSESARRARCC